MIQNKKTKLNARILRMVGGDKHTAYLWWNGLNKALGKAPKAMWRGTAGERLTLIMYVLTVSDGCGS